MSHHADSLPEDRRIECAASEGFVSWRALAHGSIAITTYQAGKVALVGLNGNQVSLMLRDFEKPLALAVTAPEFADWLRPSARLDAPATVPAKSVATSAAIDTSPQPIQAP